jgi:hypothetical protein
MDALSGVFRQVVETGFVNTHEGAYQQWLGSSNRIAYLHEDSEGSSIAGVDAEFRSIRTFRGDWAAKL